MQAILNDILKVVHDKKICYHQISVVLSLTKRTSDSKYDFRTVLPNEICVGE